jgi:hypothetical protein
LNTDAKTTQSAVQPGKVESTSDFVQLHKYAIGCWLLDKWDR